MKQKHENQPAALNEIRFANNDVKKTRRDAVALGRIALGYNASDEALNLFKIIDDERLKATQRTVNAIFMAGHEFCVKHAEEVLNSLR